MVELEFKYSMRVFPEVGDGIMGGTTWINTSSRSRRDQRYFVTFKVSCCGLGPMENLVNTLIGLLGRKPPHTALFIIK